MSQFENRKRIAIAKIERDIEIATQGCERSPQLDASYSVMLRVADVEVVLRAASEVERTQAAAVQAEREACAKAVEFLGAREDATLDFRDDAVTAIRARSEEL